MSKTALYQLMKCQSLRLRTQLPSFHIHLVRKIVLHTVHTLRFCFAVRQANCNTW